MRLVGRRLYVRAMHTIVRPVVLGIETSCDDSAAGIVDGGGHVLGTVCV
jgi:hypothetical protein